MDEFKVIFAEQAERDLKSITAYISKLSSLPERGRVVPEIGHTAIREIIFRSYRIVYRVQPGLVEIIRFWHAARGSPEISLDSF